jgi:tetratricopeptide (TPR) repeat protein
MRIYVICISIVFGFFANAQESSFSPEILGMEQITDLIANDNLQEAIYQINKSLFAQPEENTGRAYFLLGQCYFRMGDFSRAGIFFDKAYFAANDELTKKEAILSKVQTLLVKEKHLLALGELYQFETGPSDPFFQRYHLYFGLIQFKLGDYELAGASFEKCIDDSLLMRAVFNDVSHLQKPSSRTAIILSALLPGLGQLYAGAYGEALNSLIINGIFITISAFIWVNVGPIDALLSVIPWFQRYYGGGYNKAGLLARRKQAERQTEFLAEVLNMIEKSP